MAKKKVEVSPKLSDLLGLIVKDISREEDGKLRLILENGYYIEVSGHISIKKGKIEDVL